MSFILSERLHRDAKDHPAEIVRTAAMCVTTSESGKKILRSQKARPQDDKRRRTFALTALAITTLLALPLIAAPPTQPLVSYSFDDELIDSGPDTFAVFQNSKGHVSLSRSLHYSGYRSIELQDAIGDRDFPELQGYVPERTSGVLYFHFAFLIVNPEQTFNIALAGPNFFTLQPNGIAFWLKNRDGVLCHVSDSIPKKLFPMQRFVWYLIDLRYDIDAGLYDLIIHQDGIERPLVKLLRQPNAANAPLSAVDKFSFVGDVFGDASNVTYYVDDVMIGTDEQITLPPVRAPGRRKLFIDLWNEAAKKMIGEPKTIPLLSLRDFGIDDAALRAATPEVRSAVDAVMRGRALNQEIDDSLLAPVVKWRRGSALLDNDPKAAAQLFAAAAKEHPNAMIFPLGEIFALLRQQELEAAEARWRELEPIFRDDPRYGLMAAMIGLRRNQLNEAEERLRELARGRPDEEVVAAEYFFVLLWQSKFSEAERYAATRATKDAPRALWLERQGDALFLGGDRAAATTAYQKALALNDSAYGPLTKLSDLAHLRGDVEGERSYRERVYGSLRK